MPKAGSGPSDADEYGVSADVFEAMRARRDGETLWRRRCDRRHDNWLHIQPMIRHMTIISHWPTIIHNVNS